MPPTADAIAENLLDNLPTVALSAPQPAVHSETLAPGSHVGRYLIVEHVGAGGLGDVYKAYDPELDRRVAIKVLRSEVVAANQKLGDPTDRLLREAQALAKLRHPNVVTIHDVGTVHDDVFIAMEFAEGRTLLPWARAHGHQWSAIRDVLVRAGEGLAAAHAAGLVHRDFKPANVVVGDDRHVTVLDFGLARAVEGTGTAPAPKPTLSSPSFVADPASSLLTREVTGNSLLLGTPPYMAPELYSASPASESTDQFAYCATLYRLLFNRLPFVAETSAEFCTLVAEAKLDWSGNKIPGWLARVIAKGLSARPQDRFGDMRLLLDALQTDRRRRRKRWLALSILIPLATVATAATAWALRPPPTAAELAATDTLVVAARAAAARGFYVHPSADAPQEPTAFSRIVELEALEGAVEREADALASELREEFATALIRLGDRYYDRDGGAPFAADFYAAALVFVPTNAHASGRVALSQSQLAALAEQAQAQSFSKRELAAAEPLAILATAEEPARAEKLARFLERDDATPTRTRTMLAGLVRTGAQASPPPAQPVHPTAPSRPSPAPEVAPTPDVVPESPPSVVPTDAVPSLPSPTASKPDTARAASEAAAGTQALRQGDLTAAAKHFHRALESNRKNVAALRGLAELHYERGEYGKALRFGRRGRAVAPRSKRLLLLIGDACVKTLDYSAARKAYQSAASLGSTEAPRRLERLSAKLGQ